MKNILHIMSGHHSFTGVASYLYQQYKYMDRSKVHYDFLFCKENSMELVMDDPIFADSKFYVLNARNSRTHSTEFGKVMREMDSILRKTHYDAVVVDTSIVMIAYITMRVVSRFPDVKFIAHAHNTDLILPKSAFRRKIAPIMTAVDNIMRKRIRSKAYALFACSEDAGIVTFGKDAVRMSKFKIIHNSIDLSKFKYDETVRCEIRDKMSIEPSTVVVGNVGMLTKRKNQAFLIRVFRCIKEKIPEAQLWLIGDGADREMLESLAGDLGIEDSVIFFGQRNDANRLFQAMDVFVFTTLSEGLGIVAIEAQAAGLPTIVSNGVPDEVMITPLIGKVSLSESADIWANKTCQLMQACGKRTDYSDALRAAGYDIFSENKLIEEYYCQI